MRRAVSLLAQHSCKNQAVAGEAVAGLSGVGSEAWRQPRSAMVAELHRRLSGSAPSLALAYEPDTLVAWPREESGGNACARLRKSGRTPATIFSLPGNKSKLVHLDSRVVARQVEQLGRAVAACRIYNVDVQGQDGQTLETHRVLLRQLHINAVSDEVENVTLMHCPEDRRVTVNVPVWIIGEDVCPGIKRGGHVHRVMREVPISVTGDSVPLRFLINVSRLDLGAKVELDDLQLPPGAHVVVKDSSHPVCKIGGREKRA